MSKRENAAPLDSLVGAPADKQPRAALSQPELGNEPGHILIVPTPTMAF